MMHCYDLPFGDDAVPTKNKKTDDTRLPLIECICGAKILLVPNVKQMSKAIEAHAEGHAKKMKGATQKEKEAEAERIRDLLTAKVLKKAGET
jgi:hypothetical protein